jgi:hypothetical protein
MACGEGSLLSHRSAAALWGLLPHPAKDAGVHVTVMERHVGKRRGVLIHFVRSLGRDERTTLNRIPVTTPARTVLDIAGEVRARELEQAVAQAPSSLPYLPDTRGVRAARR